MSRALACLVLLSACGGGDQLQLILDIRESSERRLFSSVEQLHLRAERDGKALVEETYPPTTTEVAVHGVPFGANTTFTLEGTSTSGDIIARGSTCPVDFEAPGAGGALRASLYFSPTNTFAATAGEPLSERVDPLALTLPTGDILLSGGRVGGEVVAGSEVFSVPSSRFVASDSTLNQARAGAEVVQVSNGVVLVVGGQAGDGSAIADAEILRYDTGLYTSFSAGALGHRTGHRALRLPDDSVLITGGSDHDGGAPMGSTVFVRLQGDGSATASPGVDLIEPRRKHAAVVASGIPIVIGGYGTSGTALSSMEALRPQTAAGDVPSFSTLAQLRTARAEATATLLLDGTILVVGGAADAAGTPLPDAEVFNPITRLTQVYPLANARRGHSATPLPDGRVLVIGGFGPDGAPLASVELFIPSVGFVSERPLKTARAGQRALTLCDGTVLVVGGGPGAELYAPPL
jgi:hypothetical protein